MPEELPPLDELRERLERSRGERVARAFYALHVSGRILSTNAVNLRKAIDVFTRPDLIAFIWRGENRRIRREHQLEVLRLLHNFLASVASLRDHTRAFINRHATDDAFLREYATRVESTFASNPHAVFVQDMRNYMLHAGLNAIRGRLTVGTSGTATSHIHIDLEGLRGWDGWSSLGKAKLAGLTDPPLLVDLVSSYEALVSDFYRWFADHVTTFFAEDLAEAQRIRSLLRQALQQP